MADRDVGQRSCACLASPVWRLLLVMASLSGGVFWFVNTLQMSRFQKEVSRMPL
jgi:hypothetical protein